MSPPIVECLAASLSSDPNVRMTAELKINELLPNSETAVTLSAVALAQDVDISLRQISCIILRKYINERWSPYFSHFKGNAPPPEVKGQIRSAVFQGLSDPNRKIRSYSALTISLIANSDWPDEYPDLLTALMSLLSSTSPEPVHGGMQVLNEFIKADLTEDQILPVLRQLLPVLLSILGSTQYSPLTRSRAVSVFRQCVSTLFMVRDQHPHAVKEATGNILPVWLEAFKVLLNTPPQQDIQSADNWDGLAIRMEIFKTLDTTHMSFPKAITPYLGDFLSCGLAHLQQLLPTFSQYYLSLSSPSPPNTSEDEPMGLSMLACPVLDFISSVVRGGKAKAWLQPQSLEALIVSVFGWIQMTEEDEDTWGNDANAFVAQEDDETQTYSLRVAGLDLLSTLVDRQPAATARALSQSVSRVVSESQQSRASGNPDWWRPLEAAFAALGSVAESVLEVCDDEEMSGRPKPVAIEPLLADVIPTILTQSEYPFLQGRSFVFASQYGKLLPMQLAGQYLNAAVDVIEAQTAGIPIKVSAVKAIQNFCSSIDDDSALAPHVLRIAKDLGPFLLVTSEDTLSLVLETLAGVVEVDKGSWLDPDLAQSLVAAMLQVWSSNNKDPILVSILTDIFATLTSSNRPGVYESVVKQALPTLSTAIGTSDLKESWVASTAIELVTSLESGASANGLGEGFFATLAPSLFACLRAAEDRDVLQNGAQCLTWVVRKDTTQLLNWHDEQGRSGIDNTLEVIAKLLANEDESGGLVIGDLIIHLLRRASSAVIPVLPDLLQAMVRRMLTAKTATFVQSLVIPFAYLVQSERDTVLSLLESINVDGRTGLDILIQTWCENAEVFQGFWPSRISTLGICQLLASERSTLQALHVKGDLIVKPETRNVIVTRSKAKTMPHEFTSIPFPLKAIKLLINDLRANGESTSAAAQNAKIDTESESGESWEDEEKLANDELAFLSDLIGPRGVAFDNDDLPADDSEDEDIKADPVSQMDMKAHLLSFLRECSTRNTSNFNSLADQLNTEEMVILKAVLTEQPPQ